MARKAKRVMRKKTKGTAAAEDGGTGDAPAADSRPDGGSGRERADGDANGVASTSAPSSAARSGLPAWLNAAVWAAGAGATYALQRWLRRAEEKRLEADELRVRDEWRSATEARLDVLLTGSTAAHDAAHPAELWGPPQRAAWLDVLLNGLWADMLSGLLERLAPAYMQDVLDVYLQARDIVPIPDFITHMRVVSLAVGARCPFGVRAIRVAKPSSEGGDLVMDVDVEVLSSSADIVIHALVNDLVAPLLSRLGLRREDESYIALHVSDVRLSGTLRVRIAPGARLAAVGFAAPPSVALGMTLAYHNKLGFEERLPVSALPGVVPMMEVLVGTEVAEYAVWPRFFAVDLAPPLLLGLPSAPPRGPQGRLRVTLRAVRGVGAAHRAGAAAVAPEAAAEAPEAADEAPAAAAEAPEGAAAAARAVTPFAVLRWSTGLRSHRTAAASAPLDAHGCAAWGGEGECFDGDTFSPFGLEFLSLELRAPGVGRLGGAQLKLQALSTGETLFSFAGAHADAFTPLPQVVVGDARDAYERRTRGLLPGRTEAPGVSCSGELNALEAWLPLDGQPGAAALLRVEVDWLRAGGARAPAARAGGFMAAVTAARGAAAVRERMLLVAVAGARGLPRKGTFALAVGRPGDWRAAARTGTTSGDDPRFNDAFELRESVDAPVVTLIQLRSKLQPGPPETPLAAAPVPATQLRAGDAAAMWVKLAPLPGGPAGVEVLLRCALCDKV